MSAPSHESQPVLRAGRLPGEAGRAIVLLHGRGGSARDMLPLAAEVGADDFAQLAPQARGNTWYPLPFMEPIDKNEPALGSALATVGRLLDELAGAGVPAERVILAGFSQGACLASEFAARNARRYGGLLLFSGGLIGPAGTPRDYRGSLAGTPVFLGCSDVDAHIPRSRVEETAATLARLGAEVDKAIYPGMGHTINRDELERAGRIVAGLDVEGERARQA